MSDNLNRGCEIHPKKQLGTVHATEKHMSVFSYINCVSKTH